MKKWVSVLLASSLMFSSIGFTTITNDVSAKESTKVETVRVDDKTERITYTFPDQSEWHCIKTKWN